MRVPYRTLSEKEYLELLKTNPVFLTSGSGISDINILKKNKEDRTSIMAKDLQVVLL